MGSASKIILRAALGQSVLHLILGLHAVLLNTTYSTLLPTSFFFQKADSYSGFVLNLEVTEYFISSAEKTNERSSMEVLQQPVLHVEARVKSNREGIIVRTDLVLCFLYF